MVRRLPNLVTFRDDPDAMLVMSLETYDEDTDTARKADIMQRDVVGRVPPVTAVGSAEDGLLVSLNQRGTCRPALHRLPVSRARTPDHRRAGRPDLPGPCVRRLADRRPVSVRQRPGQADTPRKQPAQPIPQRRGAGEGPARRRAAGRYRREPRRAVDPGRRYPRLCRRPVPHPAGGLHHRPSQERRAVDRHRRLERPGLRGRHDRLRHAQDQRHRAAGTGVEPEIPHHLRCHPPPGRLGRTARSTRTRR